MEGAAAYPHSYNSRVCAGPKICLLGVENNNGLTFAAVLLLQSFSPFYLYSYQPFFCLTRLRFFTRILPDWAIWGVFVCGGGLLGGVGNKNN